MLSQPTAYAASALAFIAATGGKPVGVKAIAEACDIPSAYLAKIINTLARKNLVTTQRGVGGGVVLREGPRKSSYTISARRWMIHSFTLAACSVTPCAAAIALARPTSFALPIEGS